MKIGEEPRCRWRGGGGAQFLKLGTVTYSNVSDGSIWIKCFKLHIHILQWKKVQTGMAHILP